MGLVSVISKGNFEDTFRYFQRLLDPDFWRIAEAGAQKGVEVLARNTPVDSGITADSWYYDIQGNRRGFTITWYNSNMNNGFNVALGLQYGHGTGTGGWVEGRDYINPAIQPVLEEIANNIWEEVKGL